MRRPTQRPAERHLPARRRRTQRRLPRSPLPLEALLVDVDGTLFSSNESHTRAWREVFAERGIRIPLERIRPLMGMGGEDLAAQLVGDRLEPREFPALADRHALVFERGYMKRLKEVPGARRFLRDCHGRGLRIVLASSGKAEQVEALIGKLRARPYIEGVTNADDVRRPKPAPDLFRAALRKFDLPEATVVIGDTPYDVRAAHAAGLPAIAVLTGGFPRASLAAAERLYRSIGDMLADLVWSLR